MMANSILPMKAKIIAENTNSPKHDAKIFDIDLFRRINIHFENFMDLVAILNGEDYDDEGEESIEHQNNCIRQRFAIPVTEQAIGNHAVFSTG